MFENIKEYKGLKVIIKKGLYNDRKRVLASYSTKTKSITIYSPFYKESMIEQKTALTHEFAHHILLSVAPFIVKRIWILLSKGKFIKLLNQIGITKYTQNAFARKYGETNWKEDFATCIGELKRQELKGKRKLNTFADIKIFVAKAIFDKYK